MSIMFLNVRSVSRGRGGSAVAKAAYIARDRFRDARTGVLHDYHATPGLQHAQILLPSGAPAEAGAWARDRATLWNRAEAAENPRNARVGREYIVSLPHELSPAERQALALAFGQRLADRYGAVVDVAIHGPTPRGDPRNHHAHLLASTRELGAAGFTRKTTIELNNTTRRERGLVRINEEFRDLRASWAALANERLREAGIEARLEPRSKAELARVQRLERAVPAEPGAAATLPVAPPAALPSATPATDATPIGDRSLTVEAAQQRAVERWLAYRAGRDAGAGRESARERVAQRGLDAGFEL